MAGNLQSQPYKIVAGLDNTTADGEKDVVFNLLFGVLKLKNCYVNRRRGAIIKRPGSMTEDITGGLVKPLGMGIYKRGTEGNLMPFETVRLINFGGISFQIFDAGVYANLPVNANCNFSILKQNQFEQLGDVMGIAGGKPARYRDGDTEIEMMGYPAPVGTITFTTAAGALSPLYGYQWIYTFYNSITGKESDWSLISASSGAQSAKLFNLTIPTTAPGSSADQKRIYRNTDGTNVFRLVTTIPIATAAYADNTIDTALGDEIADEGDHGLPPDESYILKKFASRFMLNDASNPYQLALSKPFIGDPNDVEYFPDDSRLTFPHEITGGWEGTAGMYVFGGREISLLTGFSFDTFQIQSFKKGQGTYFPNSICGNGDIIIFLGEDGIKSISGGRVEDISYNIDEDLRELLSRSYNNYIYVACAWSHSLRMFIFSFSASSGDGTPWILSAGGGLATWELSATSVTEEWSIPGSSGDEEATTRVKMWGWSPGDKEWCEFGFAQCPDLNDFFGSVNFLVTPYPSSSTFDPQQEITFLGIDAGAGDATVVGAFRTDINKDDAENVSAIAITDKIQPGQQNSRYKRFRSILFEGEYVDITSSGGTIKYIRDFDDPQLRDYSAVLEEFYDAGDAKNFVNGKAKGIHLEVKDETDQANNIMLEKFVVNFVEKQMWQGR